MDLGDINPYVLDEETRYMLKTSHYVLGETKYRELQERAHQRKLKREQMAKSLGVDIAEKLTDKEAVFKKVDCTFKYLENREEYDQVINQALQSMSAQQLHDFLESVKPKA